MKDTTDSKGVTAAKDEGQGAIGSLSKELEEVSDPRAKRGQRYGLVDLMTLFIMGKMAGEDSFRGIAEWVKLREAELVEELGLKRGRVPHATTYARVFGKLDNEALERATSRYFSQQHTEAMTVSIDGKTLRGTIPSGQSRGLHLLAAYATELGCVVGQVAVPSDHNEASTAPTLLSQLDLKDRVVIGDAMFTQQSLCDQIVEAGGDYVLPVKANQPTLQKEIADAFIPPIVTKGHSCPTLPYFETQSLNKQHGRVELRYLTASDALQDYLQWPHLQQVFRLQRVVRFPDGRLTYQVIFGITSLSHQQAPASRLLHLLRDHWHIENRLHYVRDVTFHEDACRVRLPHRQRFLAIINNLVIGLIRRAGFEFIPQARRYFDFHFRHALRLIT